MDLQKITLENFKCFEPQTEIEFGKLTLLTGANSSGKSSIIYSILGAIQSGEFPFQFSTNGKYVNMGDFKEIIYNHNRSEKIRLDFTFKNDLVNKIQTVWIEDGNNNLPKLYELYANADYFNLAVRYTNRKYITDFSYDPHKDPTNKGVTIEFLEKINNVISEFAKKVSNEVKKDRSLPEEESGLSDYLQEINSPIEIKGLILDDVPYFKTKSEEKGIFRLKVIFNTLSNLFNSYDQQINFISSFRLHPDRTYLEQTKSRLKVNNYGDGYLDQIIYWETKNRQKFKQLIRILKDLSLLESIKSKRLEGGRYEISVQVKKGGIDASLSDVGFGVSQFLPIIVADLQLPSSSTLFIAQPEIHLHPSVQSSFGDYLVKQMNSGDKKYVIETHSEYLLNKMRLAIVKGEMKEEDLRILFIDNEANENKIHKITFNKKGEILNAPQNFFKTYMMDVMQIAINASE